MKGTATNCDFFRLSAESDRMRKEWPDFGHQEPTHPLGSRSAAFLIRNIRFTQVVPPAFGPFVSVSED